VPRTCVTWADALQSAVSCPVPGEPVSALRTCDDLRLAGLKLIFLTVSSAMSLLGLSRRESWWKDAEILVVRREALLFRMEVEDLRLPAVAAVG
jgi:hypothetical protein